MSNTPHEFNSILRRTWDLYIEALRSWGWIVILVAVGSALIGLYQLNARIEKAIISKPYIAVKVTYRFEQTMGSSWGILAGLVKEIVASINEGAAVTVAYKDFDHNNNDKIDMGVLNLKSQDEAALNRVQEQILPVIDEEIRTILERRLRIVEKAVTTMKLRFGDLGSSTWSEERLVNLSDVKSVIIDYETLESEYRQIKAVLGNLGTIREIERVEKKAGLISGDNVWEAAPHFLIFSLIGALLLVFIFQIGLIRASDVISDDH